MKSVPFLWEIGCEEIPADWLPGVTEQLRRLFARSLEGAGLGKGVVEVYGTPRRLVVHVPELQEKQPHRREEITGPPLRIARTAGGKWSRAACGFARKNRIDPKKLVVIRKEKGEYVGFVREVKGLAAFKLLPSLMASTLRELRFPKFMSWDAELPDGRGAFPFGRPIRWMICVLGGRVVPFEIRVEEKGKVKAGKYSRGHRFLAPPRKRPGARFAATSFRELKQGLERHYVLLDSAERRARIEKALQRVEKKAKAKRAAGLSVDLVANLVEWPGSVLGTYPDEFLSLPEEVRHTVLIHHQKYFPLMGKPAFVAVTNMASDPKGFIRKGSERVVAARLRDAKFFWEEDLKKRLIERKPRLQGVVFHEKLGTYRDKVERMVALARWLAQRAGLPSGPVERAAELAKCDLTTAMVGEFPELQGIMGGLYAREQGEPEEVWKAVYSHYRPVGLGEDEDFPLNREGALVSLADKLDTLTGMFSVGEAPTGSSDPFGLRRIALGALRILLEAESRLHLEWDSTLASLLDEAVRPFRQPVPEALEDFVTERLRFIFSRDYRYDEINAVFALGALDVPPIELARRLAALAMLRGSEDFEALSIAFKRVRNILSAPAPRQVDPEVFVEKAEGDLWTAFKSLEPDATDYMAEGHYADALRTLSRLRPQVDAFFDKVLVMDPDPRIRENRLALLHSVQSLFSQLADLSEIVPGPEAGSS